VPSDIAVFDHIRTRIWFCQLLPVLYVLTKNQFYLTFFCRNTKIPGPDLLPETASLVVVVVVVIAVVIVVVVVLVVVISAILGTVHILRKVLV